MSDLPKNCKWLSQIFDKCGDLFKATDNSNAVVKNTKGKSAAQGSLAMSNKGMDNSCYYFEFEH